MSNLEPSEPELPVEAGQTAPVQGLAKVAAGGAAWMGMLTVWLKVLGVVTQFALGLFMTDEDFGLWALTLGAGVLFGSLRDVGVPELVTRSGLAYYNKYGGSLFWLGFAGNATIGGLSAVAAVFFAESEAKVGLLILMFSGWYVMQTFETFSIAICALKLDFRTNAAVGCVSNLTKTVVVILLAWLGFGAFSLMLSWFAQTIIAGFLYALLMSDRPWKKSPVFSSWPQALGQLKWLMISRYARGYFNSGDYLVVGLVSSLSVNGLYYFAFWSISQLGQLFASGFQGVLLSTFSKIADDHKRVTEAFSRAVSIQMLLGTLGCGLMAAVSGPLTTLLWGEKWVHAVVLMQVMGVLFPMRMTQSLTLSVLQAQGRFKIEVLTAICEAACVMGAALAAASLHMGAMPIILSVGSVVFVTRFIICLWMMGGMPSRLRKLTRIALVPTLLNVAMLLATVWLDQQFFSQLLPEERSGAAVRLMLTGATYTVFTFLLALTILRSDFKSVKKLMPEKLNVLINRVPLAGKLLALWD